MSTPHMRLITSPQTPGMPIEINGVKIPVDSWTVSPNDYGQTSGSVQVDLRFYADLAAGPEPETAEQRAARIQAEEAAELAALVAEWQTARHEAGSPAVQAVFDLHNPRRRYQAIECDHCQLSSGTPEADHAIWPCATYTALTGKPEPDLSNAERERLGASAVSATGPLTAPTPHADDTVHFLAPGRPGCTVAFVYRVNANGSLVLWPCLDAGPYPRDIVEDQTARCATSWHWPCDGARGPAPATDRPAPNATVQIHIDGPTLHAAVNKQLLAEYRAYPHMFRR